MSVDDRTAILEAVQRYSHAIDSRDAGAYVALFVEEGRFEAYSGARGEPFISERGREAIRRWLLGAFERWGEAQTRHHQSGTVFDALSADTARTRTMLLETRVPRGERAPAYFAQGVYTDDWVRTANGWRLTKRSLRLDG